MSKYFNPVEFPDDTPQVEPSKITSDKINVDKLIPIFEEEIEKIAAGTSSYQKIPVQLTEKGIVRITLTRLKATPTRKNAKMFLEATRQDISVRVAEYFTSLFQKELGSL